METELLGNGVRGEVLHT
ncbi:unnamed protein product [Tuber melanosporum]|uniref:(Perigord truffle) hypothetical protein n=1 Tax=Tuber melanosporum (strain Mel28) TaxID=656061 RepID=D5GGI8_TUBMM|nr:unnamed protein product [Tuber melanosporum]